MNQTAGAHPAAKIGFSADDIVMEIGWDDDVDESWREAIEEIVGSEIEDETYDGVVDSVLVWFRDGDGDLTDDVVDALATLEDKGFVLLMTPKAGSDLAIDAADVQEAATTAGLKASSTFKVGDDWIGTKLVQGGAAKQR
ncbi:MULTISPECIES: DUF3052 domain-containing protein [Dermacoccus]|uniref:Uncharacterized protein n=1 Tax=Dermacoccus nishinomiyaensis TaxID=1274 RepID=A0A075JGU5_9MICO|nr:MULTISPECIES: DUF3052 domain-containing protein [Dermacoccus]AIF41050.1 hypothetical protein HX89_08955 [Dermacoccus nishinomiyaensis]EFP58885.1 hypothetical protein HMPREF0321_1629 [Dermacoccus sp. Ellin185]MCT1604798.1 DUF3052 domain-containing protein [Dermacoccus nishinomiyaensis]TCJ91952.1 DUF3052 family protein [Dermacoccus sp. SAI-028]STD12767.1 Protein of uncharacterised function (DUF3052) [Dermacoccus nishinomiyaensis]